MDLMFSLTKPLEFNFCKFLHLFLKAKYALNKHCWIIINCFENKKISISFSFLILIWFWFDIAKKKQYHEHIGNNIILHFLFMFIFYLKIFKTQTHNIKKFTIHNNNNTHTLIYRVVLTLKKFKTKAK